MMGIKNKIIEHIIWGDKKRGQKEKKKEEAFTLKVW